MQSRRSFLKAVGGAALAPAVVALAAPVLAAGVDVQEGDILGRLVFTTCGPDGLGSIERMRMCANGAVYLNIGDALSFDPDSPDWVRT